MWHSHVGERLAEVVAYDGITWSDVSNVCNYHVELICILVNKLKINETGKIGRPT